MVFERHIGRGNRAKIDQKKQRKNDEKMNATKMPKKSQQEKKSVNLIEIPPTAPIATVQGNRRGEGREG